MQKIQVSCTKHEIRKKCLISLVQSWNLREKLKICHVFHVFHVFVIVLILKIFHFKWGGGERKKNVKIKTSVNNRVIRNYTSLPNPEACLIL